VLAWGSVEEGQDSKRYPDDGTDPIAGARVHRSVDGGHRAAPHRNGNMNDTEIAILTEASHMPAKETACEPFSLQWPEPT